MQILELPPLVTSDNSNPHTSDSHTPRCACSQPEPIYTPIAGNVLPSPSPEPSVSSNILQSVDVPQPAVAECTASGATRDKELFYPNGDLVLIAQGVDVRVFYGPIVDQSNVFRDMIGIPQPTNSDQPASAIAIPSTRCITLHLTDSAEDLRHLLRVFVGKSVLWYDP